MRHSYLWILVCFIHSAAAFSSAGIQPMTMPVPGHPGVLSKPILSSISRQKMQKIDEERLTQKQDLLRRGALEAILGSA
jgi:hypothetical protein